MSDSATKAGPRPVPKVLLQAKKEATMQASGKEKLGTRLGRKVPGIRDIGQTGSNSYTFPTPLQAKILKGLLFYILFNDQY